MEKKLVIFAFALLASASCAGTIGPGSGGGPASKPAWMPISPQVPGLGSAIQVNAEDEIYAVIGNQICKWNGTTWAPLTAVAPAETKPAFAFVSESLIYAMIGNQICKWNGTAWSSLTAAAPAETKPAFQFTSESLIYAMIGNQVCKWNGTAW